MTKVDFISALHNGLNGLPKEDIQEHITYYCEMIDDRMEDGLTEEEAISQLGSTEQVVNEILANIPMKTLIKTKTPAKISSAEITLISLGSPVWFPILIAIIAVLFSVYISLWAVAICLWAVFVALAGSGLGGVAGGIIIACRTNTPSGIALLGAGLMSLGLSVFAFYGSIYITKGLVSLTKWLWLSVKKRIMRKENGR